MDRNIPPKLVFLFEESTNTRFGIRPEGPMRTSFPDDINPEASSALIKEVKSVAKQLGAATRTAQRQRQVPRGEVHFDGGVTSTFYQDILVLFGSGGAGWMFLKQVQPLILQWLKNMASRSVTVKRGDLSIEIKGKHDIEEVLSILKEFDDQHSGNTVASSQPKKSLAAKASKASIRPTRPTARRSGHA